jgi:hypothetical protein
MAISPLFAAESEVVPFEAPNFGLADEYAVGATEDPKSSVTETELVPFGILEVKADELAIGESADTQDPKDENNIASLVDERNATISQMVRVIPG